MDLVKKSINGEYDLKDTTSSQGKRRFGLKIFDGEILGSNTKTLHENLRYLVTFGNSIVN